MLAKALNQRRTDHAMAKGKKTKKTNKVQKTLHRKLSKD
jgi:hypothetical protein